ncbi:MAG: hypothetical protein KKC80_01710 [Candidatus Margulisbacteria bacterium]|nr:hypothetical protein [Candidatus Margulisiibacteriota bacterium]
MNRRSAALLLGLIVLSLPASARFISLQTTITASVGAKTAAINFSAVNKGDEPAHNIWSELVVFGRTYSNNNRTVLPPSEKYLARYTIPLAGQKGSYPLLLTIHYTDGNQYPFSALTAAPLIIGREPPAALWGVVKPAAFTKDGEIEVALKNMTRQTQTIGLALFLPQELNTDLKPAKIDLSPGSNRTIKIKLSNFSALPGSSYQLFIIAQTDGESGHTTAIIPGNVKIEKGSMLWINPAWLIGLLAGLGAVFIAAQFYKK